MPVAEDLKRPLEHLGATDPVTATDLRNFADAVADALHETGHPKTMSVGESQSVNEETPSL